MSDQPNDPPAKKLPAAPEAASNAQAATPSSPAPAAGGMKSTLKIVIPLAVLVAVVFGITYFAQYTPKADDKTKGSTKAAELPLRFYSSSRAWNPTPEAGFQDQIFPGFYELKSNGSASFMFENRNRSAVAMTLQGAACNLCGTSAPIARLAIIPPEVIQQLPQLFGKAALPLSWFSELPLGFAKVARSISPEHLNWQQYSFQNVANATFAIPAANESKTPLLGILELQFAVNTLGPGGLKSEFTVTVNDTKVSQPASFQIAFEGVDPFEVADVLFDAGEFTDDSAPRQFTALLYSSTRGPNSPLHDLPTPTTRVDVLPDTGGEPGPFVSVGEITRVPENEIEPIEVAMTFKTKKPTKVLAAYRVPITVAPRVGDKRIDIGPFEREVLLKIPGVDREKGVRVKGLVRGPVWLDNNRKVISLADRYSSETVEKHTIITQQRDAELSVVASQCEPKWLGVSLEKLPPSSDRGYYAITLTVPPGKEVRQWNGLVVLELKGPQPRRIRIPVRGKGDP
jgi:hypothetical protein